MNEESPLRQHAFSHKEGGSDPLDALLMRLKGYDYDASEHKFAAADPATKALLIKDVGAGGVTTYLGLTDTSGNYVDQALKYLRVKGTEDGIEFVSAVGGVTDHGELDGLGDDDHTQYYNSARHTKAVHDTLALHHGSLSGLGDDDHVQYLLKTKSYGAGNAFARAYVNAPEGTYSTSGSTPLKIPFNAESYDPGGNFSLVTKRLTAPVSGYYHILGQTAWEDEQITDKDVFETYISRSGTIILSSNEASPSTGGTDINPIVNDIRHVNAGQWLEMYGVAYRVGGGNGVLRTRNEDMNNFLTVWLVKAD